MIKIFINVFNESRIKSIIHCKYHKNYDYGYNSIVFQLNRDLRKIYSNKKYFSLYITHYTYLLYTQTS